MRKEKGTKTSINFKSFFCLGKKVFFFAKKNFKEGRGKKSEVESLLGMRGGGWPFSNPFPSLFSQKNRRGGRKNKGWGAKRENAFCPYFFWGAIGGDIFLRHSFSIGTACCVVRSSAVQFDFVRGGGGEA